MNNQNKTVNAICNQINSRILSMSYKQEVIEPLIGKMMI